MINEHILTLEEVVPIDIRLETYIKARDYIIATEDDPYAAMGLCLLLPVGLWDLPSYCYTKSPSGNNWNYEQSLKAFPELTQDIVDEINDMHLIKDRNKLRLQYLDQWIEELTIKDK